MARNENLNDLRAKLKARENKPGFKANVAEIKARIRELEGRQ